MRISTQVFARVDGNRKVFEHTDRAGVVRPLEVEVDLFECDICCALLPPTTAAAITHAQWHVGNGEG